MEKPVISEELCICPCTAAVIDSSPQRNLEELFPVVVLSEMTDTSTGVLFSVEIGMLPVGVGWLRVYISLVSRASFLFTRKTYLFHA